MNRNAKDKRKETLLQVIHLIRPYRGQFILSLFLAAVTVALTLYAPVLIGDGVDLIVAPGKVDFNGLIPILWKIGVVVALTGLSQWLMNLVHNRITFNVVNDMRTQAFAKLQELPLSFTDSHQNGDIISRITTDTDQFSDGLIMGFAQLFTGVITILGTLGFMVSVNFKIALAVVLITPLSLFVSAFITKRTYYMFGKQSEARGDMTSLVEEMVGNAKVVKAFGYEDDAEQRMAVINERLRQYGQKAVFFSSLTNPCTRFVNSMVYAVVGIAGAFAVLAGGLSVGQLSCFLTYANQYTKPFNEISGVVAELQNALASAQRVFDLITQPAQTPDKPDAKVLTDPDGTVKLSHVYFSYTPEKPLIEDFNLSVSQGQRIAIVGPTGCGKTTLINLLMRFYDTNQGEILISGIPIRNITRQSLRRQFGMVLQDTWLKTGTIRENISYGKPDASTDEIIAAAKAAYADGFIRRLPQGYDTMISQEGDNISQGQKQLLCIARAMLCLPQMLILDEATSSIDTRTELRVQQAFTKMMQGRTCFIVAHRLSTIKEADKILVMKDGHIIEQGRHEELLAENGFYSRLYNSQFAQVKRS
ncbi:ABC transporter ATP-binding protein [Ructibacterium gallinarum]|uniref:ABC transporter ATP-binding protein n=1 Tax=Ructibacterium gallinarum TaxID=2779355 RepID=A0A9D5M0W1_9FIRM|nr:ABC transporter ATP-binding protein [Ructibacterium gallinarum]MBE5040230.1 ABC transporter ATP-binding protein [Ructibacterium gallinarum]